VRQVHTQLDHARTSTYATSSETPLPDSNCSTQSTKLEHCYKQSSLRVAAEQYYLVGAELLLPHLQQYVAEVFAATSTAAAAQDSRCQPVVLAWRL
jgi:hypothetical protein